MYTVYLGQTFYPKGGFLDLSGHFDTFQDALNYIKVFKDDSGVWAQIVYKNQIILYGKYDPTRKPVEWVWDKED
jgi:hypothetical protein